MIMHRSGIASIEGHPDVPLMEKMLGYIPPATRAQTGEDQAIARFDPGQRAL